MKMENIMHIGLIPLDERPVNTRYPQMIAQIGGATLHLPPQEMLSVYRQPAHCDEILNWLEVTAPSLDSLIVSFQTLEYGGLIASRTSHEPASGILARLETLLTIKKRCPYLPILGFDLIMRVSNANSSIEEPEYWAEEGTRFYQLSQLLDLLEQGHPVGDDLAYLRAELPPNHVQDFIQRRMRNHMINKASLQILAHGTLDLLVLSSDDTNPYGLPASEKRALHLWADRLGISEHCSCPPQGRCLLMYPGADEVGSALTARAINTLTVNSPTFEVVYGIPGGDQITAPYEDGPVSITLERQITAVGGRQVLEGEPELWVFVNPPSPRRTEWDASFAVAEKEERLPHLKKMVAQIRQHIESGEQVIVCDVAYPNGADPLLIELLLQEVDITRLAAYGGWNTAGNTIGTALAQGCVARLAYTPEQQVAQQRFLLHRFLEDWGYQRVVRTETRQWLLNTVGHAEPDEATMATTIAHIEAGLNRCLNQLQGFANKYHLVPGSLRLPWNRLFEIDFDIG
jgi:hypothetical protein